MQIESLEDLRKLTGWDLAAVNELAKKYGGFQQAADFYVDDKCIHIEQL